MRNSVAAIACALALVGCSSGHSSDQRVASLQSSSSSHGPTPSPSSDEDRGVAYAQCMRRHGVNLPDPAPGQNGKTRVQGGNNGVTKRAMSACQHYLPSGKLNPSDPRFIDQMVQFARCLRQHGIDVADPTPAHPDLNIGSHQKNSHAFVVAAQACGLAGKPTASVTPR